MVQYCDSKILEQNWYNWLLSSSVPELEDFRKSGILWTKVLGTVKDDDGNEVIKSKEPLADPSFHTRAHCIVFGHPVYLKSYHGVPEPSGVVFVEKRILVEISSLSDELHLRSSAWIHNLDNPLSQSMALPHIENEGYVREVPAETSWHAMLRDIDKICQGIATKFQQPSDEERLDLANEALLQVTNKLVNGKLVYIPGKAPVFNLITTTIYRCMYSIMNRRTNRRQGHARLMEDAQAGILPDAQRSLRTSPTSTRRFIKTH